MGMSCHYYPTEPITNPPVFSCRHFLCGSVIMFPLPFHSKGLFSSKQQPFIIIECCASLFLALPFCILTFPRIPLKGTAETVSHFISKSTTHWRYRLEIMPILWRIPPCARTKVITREITLPRASQWLLWQLRLRVRRRSAHTTSFKNFPSILLRDTQQREDEQSFVLLLCNSFSRWGFWIISSK